MPQSYLFKRDPQWIAPISIRYKTLPDTLQSWLHENNSLTQRLRREWGEVRVQVLFEGWRVPFLSEQKKLTLPQKRLCLVREVLLYGNNVPLILARTVIPRSTLNATHGHLGRLGTRPLGEILFSSPSLARQWLAISYVVPYCLKAPQMAFPTSMPTPLWGRCTRYSLQHQPILVSEFFLPNLIQT